ncbi:PREDICTED: ubiquitin carboxyl-terminal hydrolase 27 isoform X2 [Tarenaya hassleriana]|uniref:ubiquitin carboxyl-terminal hydrolase 27 isoform X2 n=1 Tax=Tarenaya hassleriana TaxID=28532 RepID=UPI0008FD26AF|nr:PREDICTED: ubiquitin carboxyl-terminal hydrolase 27 isoform X2 [Tarenaya hassleriana]
MSFFDCQNRMKARRGPDTMAILCNLTQGFRASNWVSSLSLAGLLGVAGFVFALKEGRFRNLGSLGLFSVKDDAEDDSFLVPGLQNLGNNCFLNVILQALASCKDFRVFLQRVIDESEATVVGEQDEHLPLTYALSALLEELCRIERRRAVSSPRKVMLALSCYVQNFDLTNQQDAAEALFHLMSSLQEELTDCYIPCQSTLSDVIASLNLRILAPSGSNCLSSELERWQKRFLGPFDGILGSVLMCQTCSCQMFGCTVEDCLKNFFVAERVENYYCSKCWHAAALKYLSVRGADETDIEKLKSCTGQDICDCKSALHLETMPWSNSFSHTLKQLSIARCPKLLCIQVQRSSMTMFGESVKLRGHVAFPVVMDLSPVTTSVIGMNPEESTMRRQKTRRQKLNLQPDASLVLNLLRPTEGQILSGPVAAPLLDPDQSKLLYYSESQCSNQKVTVEQKPSRKGSLYRLVTVVEHFGRTGSGHYTGYRGVKLETREEEEEEKGCEEFRWFRISDSEVYGVPESDVLSAEASLLFYERL